LDKLVIEGGAQLNGTVSASGAKNAALPLLFSALLAEGEHVFHNVPFLKDIESACELLESLGCQCTHQNYTLRVRVNRPQQFLAHYDLVRKMRASILCLGPLVAKYGIARVSLPGGCAIGTRPIDLHLFAMQALGTQISVDAGYVNASCEKLKGNRILFENVTVGGTENALMAATLADGTTIIENAAQEPEIVDLAEYLIKMGAKIKGYGTHVIEVQGVQKLKPAEHSVLPGRRCHNSKMSSAAL
jgi:UDP-N-acetylglucosamine 1-carboxyvinyltransferase